MANTSPKLATESMANQVDMEETESQVLLERMQVAFLLLSRKLRDQVIRCGLV